MKELKLERVTPAPSLKEMALSAIKEAILGGKLTPAVMYTEAALTAKLGISRTPVREALIHLASRGLITYFPRRGFKVVSLSRKDVEDLFELRVALELAVIRHITPVLTEEALEKIAAARLSLKVQPGDPLASLLANRHFHICLAELTENPYLINALDQIRDLTDLAGSRSLELASRSDEAAAEHERIFEVLKRRSLPDAIREMEGHILITKERVLARI